MNRWEKLYYVGADAKESAVLQGEALVDAYRKDSRTLDANGNGLVSYVLLEGETSHQDSLIRTEWSIQTSKAISRRSAGENHGKDCQLGQEPGFGPYGTVAERVPGAD